MQKNFYHPTTEDHIIKLVKYARDNGLHVRVRGAGHSMVQAIFTDGSDLDQVHVLASAPDSDDINIILDKYNKIISKNGDYVKVEAGISLGGDPINCSDEDEDSTQTLENSFLYQIDKDYGLAIDALGGISHQTVGGFLSTGSAGGTLQYSIHDNVHAIRFVDGNGEIFEVSREDED